MSDTTIDEQARRLVAEVSAAAIREAQVPRPSRGLLSDLYLRTRDCLRGIGPSTAELEAAASDLALALYCSWLAEVDPPSAGLLPVLEASVRGALIKARSDDPTAIR